MKKLAITLVTLLLCICAISQTPMMTMTTTKDIGSTFSFGLASKVANTVIQVDFGDGTPVNKTIGTARTTITGTLIGSQTVKIYGTGITSLICANIQLIALDVTNNSELTGLESEFNQITSLDVSKNNALIYIECNNNLLSSLDVTKNIALETLMCSYNQLSVLDITKNTALKSLWCGSNKLTMLDITKNTILNFLECESNHLTTLDVTEKTALTDLWCSNNQLTSIDVTKNTLLTKLECYNNPITALDITKNISLKSLNCYNNKLTVLDVTKNTALTYLSCGTNLLNTLDVTQNKALQVLGCSSSKLITLDITQNSGLQLLDCSSNQLSTLDLSKNTAINQLWCAYNNFTFVTMPMKQISWTTFSYAPQKPIFIGKSLFKGFEVDLSDQLSINGNITVYTWKTKSGTTLVEGSDYTLTNGKTVFLKTQTDSVYCEMTNTTFPDFTGSNVLKTINAAVIEPPVISMTALNNIGSSFYFEVTADFNNTPIKVDFGDGNLINKTIGTSYSHIIGTLIGSKTVKIYGAGIYNLYCAQINALDITQYKALRILDCSHNNLTSLDVSKNIALIMLNCAYNRITSLDVSNNKALTSLHCSDNQKLTALDVSQNTALKELNCGYNQLTSIDVSKNTKLEVLICDNNQLSYATLPLKQSTWTTFIYSPQYQIPIVKTLKANVELNLSNQLTVNGNFTAYTWKTKSGVTLEQGTDYTINSGKTIFLKAQTDSVYCEMTNATFPDFTGSNVLKTTFAKITSGTAITNMEAPEVEIYSNQNTLYINIPFNAQASIFEPNGRLFISKQLTRGTNSIQLRNTGIYLVKLIGNKDQITKKIFIE